jgi:putative FmdB family regulatory protein
MPLYEYTCRKCDHAFEALVFDGEEVECPQCRGRKVERLLSVPARPRAETTTLPTRCQSDGPPCGAPWCRRT